MVMIAARDLDIELLGSETSRSFGERLCEDLDSSERAAIAVAFAKRSALTRVALDDWCADGRKLELVAGTDFALTELELLERLSRRTGARCRVFHKAAARTVFHPKLYVLDQPSTASRIAYVGSANLTSGGLHHNFESVVRMAGPRDHPSLLSAEAMFSGWFDSEYATPSTTTSRPATRRSSAPRPTPSPRGGSSPRHGDSTPRNGSRSPSIGRRTRLRAGCW